MSFSKYSLLIKNPPFQANILKATPHNLNPTFHKMTQNKKNIIKKTYSKINNMIIILV
jgi:hypothetical protein